MDRRRFISLVSAGIAAAPFIKTLPKTSHNYANPNTPFDLVAVRGGEATAMFDEGIKSLGGISSFVKRGQRVVVKPNIGWDVVPERAANTNPALVGRIIQHCINAGAKEVVVFDNTCDNWIRCYKNSGIEKAVKESGGKIAPGNTESYYQSVSVPGGKRLTSAKVHELILESDVFINVPVLKNHGSAKLTICMKNLMGIVWDRGYWHRNNLHQCIADFSAFRKPDLNIVDAYNVMKQNGPRGVDEEDVILMKAMIISTDMVAADTAAAKLLDFEPKDVSYIKIAGETGIGRTDLQNLKINRIKI
ncbi:MAG: DUF362 domain-containing protein [Ignavibacteriaceae bacterium]|nr:DUF362 domain-containing protein [Ignavibacteriaceae bacterium]